MFDNSGSLLFPRTLQLSRSAENSAGRDATHLRTRQYQARSWRSRVRYLSSVPLDINHMAVGDFGKQQPLILASILLGEIVVFEDDTETLTCISLGMKALANSCIVQGGEPERPVSWK